MLAVAVLVAAVLVGVLAVGGFRLRPASGGATGRTAAGGAPAVPRTGVPTPAGWTRYDYGSLSVAVPASWKLKTASVPNCGQPPPNSISEAHVAVLQVSSCPAYSNRTPPPPAVLVNCLIGKANRTYAGGTRKVVGGRTLVRNGNAVFIQDPSAEGLVVASGPADLVERILATVQPTGKHC